MLTFLLSTNGVKKTTLCSWGKSRLDQRYHSTHVFQYSCYHIGCEWLDLQINEMALLWKFTALF